MTSTTPACSVVIVIHNSRDTLEACLRALPQTVQVVLVDNASSDGGAELAEEVRPSSRVIRLPRNVGFGGGCNVGVAHASGDVVVLLNPDCVIEPGALEGLVTRVREIGNAVVGPALLDESGHVRHICRVRSTPMQEVVELLPIPRGRWHSKLMGRLGRDVPAGSYIYTTGGRVDYVQGACLALPRHLFHRVGGFDESFFLYCEEEDLCERIVNLGGQCVYEPAVRVYHAWGGSTRKVPRFATRQLFRSRTVLYRKRYGDAKMACIAAMFVCAVIGHSLAWPIKRFFGRADPRTPAWSSDALAGMFQGLAAPR